MRGLLTEVSSARASELQFGDGRSRLSPGVTRRSELASLLHCRDQEVLLSVDSGTAK
jgi:hypothetical protein